MDRTLPSLDLTKVNQRIPRTRVSWQQITRIIVRNPSRLLVSVWTLYLLLYLLGPINYVSLGLATWIFILACIFAFGLGGLFASSRRRVAIITDPIPSIQSSNATNERVNQVACLCALLGLLGTASIITDKLFLSGLDYSQGITSLRFQQMADARMDISHDRSPLLYFGFLIFSFGLVSYLLYVLKGEVFTNKAIFLSHASLISPTSYALLYGGRSPIVLLLVLVLSAMLVRVLHHQSPLPKRAISYRFLLLILIMSLLYNSYIISARAEYMGGATYIDYTTWITRLGGELPRWLDLNQGAEGFSSSVTTSVVTIYVYLTHSLPTLDKILSFESMGPYYGQYQFNLPFSLLATFIPDISLGQTISYETETAGVQGFFATAWARMYMDFGAWFAIPIIFLLGYISSRIYRRAVYQNDPGTNLLTTYIIACILLTPIDSAFSMSNSLLILVSILICKRWLRPRRRSASNSTIQASHYS